MALWQRFIAVDPGLSGGIAHVTRETGCEHLFPMPILPRSSGKKNAHEVDFLALLRIANQLRNSNYPGRQTCVVIEEVTAGKMQGATSMFSFGCSYGAARSFGAALALACSARVILVRPAKWKQALELSPEKNRSIALATRLYPESAKHITLAKHEGLAEALLLAHWAMTAYDPAADATLEA